MAAVGAANEMHASQTEENQLVEKRDMELLVYQDCAFPGLYDDVMFPVATLFCPPQPPSDLPPRVQIPPRPGPVYKNDLSQAGEVEHKAQRTVSAFWRGILCRRRLRNDRTHEHIIFIRCRTIQCWWRTIVAKRRFNQNKALKEEWVEKRATNFVKERMQAMANIMTWQRTRYEGAAITIQRVLRWFFSHLKRQNAIREGEPEDQLPEELPFPIKIKAKRYFPWRPRAKSVPQVQTDENAAAIAKDDTAEVDEEGARRRTVLHFKKTKDPVEPPTMEYVREQNKISKRKTDARNMALQQPEVQSRLEWKREGLRDEDLDFNAAIIQRLFRAQIDSAAVRGESISVAYMNNVVRVIARTFRMYSLIRRLKRNRTGMNRKIKERRDTYAKKKIDEINLKMVWGKDLLDGCAATIQKCWHWYRFVRFGVLPLKVRKQMEQHRMSIQEAKDKAAEERRAAIENGEIDEEEAAQEESPFGSPDGATEGFTFEEPQPPPYNLITEYLEREGQIKDALMNAMEKDKLQKAKSHKYVKYVPEKPIVKKKVGVWITA